MTRTELHALVTPIMDPLDDYANGMRGALKRSEAEHLVELLDILADRLMHEGVEG